MTFFNNTMSIGLVHKLFVQSKDIRGLSIGNLVCSVPFSNGTQHTWELFLDIINIIQEGSPLVFGINHNHLPVTFAFINHEKNAKDLDGSDFTRFNDSCTNFTNVQRIIVTSTPFRIRMNVGWIFPGLWETSIVEENISLFEFAKFALFGILFNGIANFVRCNLVLFSCKFRNLTNKVKIGRRFSCFCIQMSKRDIMPKRNRLSTIAFSLNSVFQRILVSGR
mmetsp:Transcript_31740/g.47158  ORF Transcript_31740/g.47158 Transcript_31740/m.47158 type:complete len:222 (-) Transcript_31740:402-1067(-)